MLEKDENVFVDLGTPVNQYTEDRCKHFTISGLAAIFKCTSEIHFRFDKILVPDNFSHVTH
jgi:hypothetical protein